MTLKRRFLEAISNGDLGEVDDFGVVVSLKQFKAYFSDVTSDYVNSFLPAAVIETGQKSSTHTKYVFRIRKGVYRVHPDALELHSLEMQAIEDDCFIEDLSTPAHINNKVEEALMQYQTCRVH